MEKEITGTIISVSQQKWLKINSKPVRMLGSDGAVYPCMIKVKYIADGKEYIKRKWVTAGKFSVGDSVKIIYDGNNPTKAKIDIRQA